MVICRHGRMSRTPVPALSLPSSDAYREVLVHPALAALGQKLLRPRRQAQPSAPSQCTLYTRPQGKWRSRLANTETRTVHWTAGGLHEAAIFHLLQCSSWMRQGAETSAQRAANNTMPFRAAALQHLMKSQHREGMRNVLEQSRCAEVRTRLSPSAPVPRAM